MHVKEILGRRFSPIPENITDPDLSGLLFVRRLKVPEMQRYLQEVSKKKKGEDDPYAAQAMLLQMAVCDDKGAPIFDSAEEASDLLGECWLPLYEQIAELMFPGSTAGEKSDPTPASAPRQRPSSG